jgi:hypothetical protein
MSQGNKIQTTDSINTGCTDKSAPTGTTVGEKRGLDVNIIGGSAGGSAGSLCDSGRITQVVLNPTSWTALPATPLADRQAINIQNQNEDINVKINYDNAVVGFVGMTIFPCAERHYAVKDDLTLYAKCESGTVTVAVEEIA